jgi:hypothetical protein
MLCLWVVSPRRLILPCKPFGFFGSIWAKSGGECTNTPRESQSTSAYKRPLTMKYYTYEILHLHN